MPNSNPVTRPITQCLVPNIQCQRRGPSRTDSRPRLMQDLDVVFAGIGCWLLAVSVWCCFLFPETPVFFSFSFPERARGLSIGLGTFDYRWTGTSPCIPRDISFTLLHNYAHNILYPTRCGTKFPIQYSVPVCLDRGGAKKKRSIGQTSCIHHWHAEQDLDNQTNHTLGSVTATELPKLMFRWLTKLIDKICSHEIRTRSFCSDSRMPYCALFGSVYFSGFVSVHFFSHWTMF